MRSASSAHSEIRGQPWHHEQDRRYNWQSPQYPQQVETPEAPRKDRKDTQQLGEPLAPLDGGSPWPPHSVWHHVAVILAAWAPVEDWEAVDTSPDSTERVL